MLSGERLIIGTAAGYLKPEFRALGIDFDNRGALLDEALDVLDKVLSGEDIAYEGTSFAARGVRLRPVPAAAPPIWVGGNSKPAVRRAVTRGQGWAPFNTFGYAAASRTAEISTLDELESAISWAKNYATEIGRTEAAGHLLLGRKPIGRQPIDRRTARYRRAAGGGGGHLAAHRPSRRRPRRSHRARAGIRERVHRELICFHTAIRLSGENASTLIRRRANSHRPSTGTSSSR